MSIEDKRRLEVGATIIVALLSLLSALSALMLLPYRMSAAESEIKSLKVERAVDHDILVRLDTTTSAIKQAMDRFEANHDRDTRDGQPTTTNHD